MKKAAPYIIGIAIGGLAIFFVLSMVYAKKIKNLEAPAGAGANDQTGAPPAGGGTTPAPTYDDTPADETGSTPPAGERMYSSFDK